MAQHTRRVRAQHKEHARQQERRLHLHEAALVPRQPVQAQRERRPQRRPRRPRQRAVQRRARRRRRERLVRKRRTSIREHQTEKGREQKEEDQNRQDQPGTCLCAGRKCPEKMAFDRGSRSGANRHAALSRVRESDCDVSGQRGCRRRVFRRRSVFLRLPVARREGVRHGPKAQVSIRSFENDKGYTI